MGQWGAIVTCGSQKVLEPSEGQSANFGEPLVWRFGLMTFREDEWEGGRKAD